MWLVWMLALLVACKTGGGDDEFPVVPGGPGGPGTMQDAAPPDMMSVEAGATIDGRICVVADLRNLNACADSGANGITVTLGGKTATTAADGSFTIDTPSATQLVWRASGANIVPSVMAFGPSTNIPAVGVQTYSDLLGANSVVLQNNQGSIVAKLLRNGAAVTGATMSTSPIAQYATKYDGPTATAWTELRTAGAGIAWIPGAQLGTNTVTVAPMTGTGATAMLAVENGAITFATIALP
jgi:hypothetical protein